MTVTYTAVKKHPCIFPGCPGNYINWIFNQAYRTFELVQKLSYGALMD